jgi:hypothetical protein
MKKLFLKSLFAAACCLVFPAGMFAQFSGSGSGTKDDPYRIFNAVQLNQVRHFCDQGEVYFSLEADIDMTLWISENNPTQGWTPIGDGTSSFSGIFNGNGHTISNLWINRPNTDNIGLFGKIDISNAKIMNLKLENADFIGNSNVGGIVGYAEYASINSCTFCGNITGKYNVGGICGVIGRNASCNSCIFYGNITGENCIGGICGNGEHETTSGSDTEIIDCKSFCHISGRDDLGGIIGSDFQWASMHKLQVENCFSYSLINGHTDIGGICGASECSGYGNAVFKNCYAYCNINSINDNSSSGGIIGLVSNANVEVSDCYSNGRINGTCSGGIIGMVDKYYSESLYCYVRKCYSNCHAIEGCTVGGVIGGLGKYSSIYIENSVATNGLISGEIEACRISQTPSSYCYYENNLALNSSSILIGGEKQPIPDDSENNGTNTGLSTLKLQATYEGLGWDFADTWQIEETESFPYFKTQTPPPYIAQALKKGDTNISGQCTEAGTITICIGDKTYITQSSGNSWNLTLDEPLLAGDVVNVFAQAVGKMPSYAVSLMVGLAGNGTESDPFLVSTPDELALISNIGANGSYYKLTNNIDLTNWIDTNSPEKGWIHVTLRGTFDGDGHTVSGLWCDNNNGGLLGRLIPGTEVKDLKVIIHSGKVVKGNMASGGIVADNMGTVTRCTITGAVEGGYAAGGIAGQNSGSISECYSSGSVVSSMANSKLGGIVGENQSGGITSDCYSSANITATGDNSYAAGIVGYNSGLTERCHSGGAISGYTVAGICGYNSGHEAELSDCVAANASLSASKSALRVLGGFSSDATAPSITENYAYDGIPVSVNNVPQQIYDDPLNGTAKSLSEIHAKATYEALGWDMTDLWRIDDGSSTPYFEAFSIPVSEISLNKTEATLERQSTLQLTATVLPEDSRNTTLSWTSDNEEVATVDENGLVTAVGEGTATITATANDGSGVAASCVVTVTFIDGIADIETSKVTVLAANGRITVSGKDKDDTVSVYDTGGRLLYQGESDVIDVPRKAMYIVTVSGKSYKVIVP